MQAFHRTADGCCRPPCMGQCKQAMLRGTRRTGHKAACRQSHRPIAIYALPGLSQAATRHLRETLSVTTSVVRALGQLGDPVVLAVLGGCVALAAMLFGVMMWLVPYVLVKLQLLQNAWLDGAIALLGGMATLLVTWFLFPPIAVALVGLFLEPIAAAVERRHYPELGPAPGIPVMTSMRRSVRLLLMLVAANALMLVLLVVPPVYLVAYYIVNGFLLGQEYAEIVGLRRCSPESVDAMIRARRVPLLLFGTLAALAATLPLLNIIAPVVLTAAMVHLVVGWSGLHR